MGIWSFWLIVAVVFMIAEVLVLSLTCMYIAIGAIAGMMCSLLGGGWTVSIIVFVVSTALLYAVTYKYRKKLLHYLHKGRPTPLPGWMLLSEEPADSKQWIAPGCVSTGTIGKCAPQTPKQTFCPAMKCA